MSVMKKIWTTVAVLAIVLVAAGIICGVVSYINGGSFAALMENHQAAFVLEWLCPVNFFPAVFGA